MKEEIVERAFYMIEAGPLYNRDEIYSMENDVELPLHITEENNFEVLFYSTENDLNEVHSIAQSKISWIYLTIC